MFGHLIKCLISITADKVQGPEALEPSEENVSLPERLVVVGGVDSSPEVSPTAYVAEELVPAGDSLSAHEDGPQESAPRELLIAVPQEYSEDDVASADAPSEDNEVDVLPESPVQHHEEDPVQIAPIIISSETSEYGAPSFEDDGPMLLTVPDDNAEVEADRSQVSLLKTAKEEESAVLTAGTEDKKADEKTFPAEEAAPEETAVIVLEETVQQEPDTESLQVASSSTKEPTEHVKEENAGVPIALEENTGEYLVIKEPKEESVVLAGAEIENNEADLDEFAAEETAPEETAVKETAEQEPHTDEEVEKEYIVSSDIKKGQEHLKEEDAVVMESAVEVEEEEEAVVLFPATFEDRVEHVAEETAPESGSVEPAVIVPVDSSEVEPEQKEQVEEEPIFTAAEEVLEAPEAEDPFTVVPADPNTNKKGQEGIATQELPPDIVVLAEHTSGEPSPKDVIVITPPEDPDKKVSEDYTEEEKVQLDSFPQEPAVEMYEPDGSDGDIFIISDTETTSRTPAQDPAETVPVTTTEILTEASVEPFTTHSPAVTDAEADIFSASVEGVSVTGFTTHSDDFKAAGILTENEGKKTLVNLNCTLRHILKRTSLFLCTVIRHSRT